MSDRPPVRQYGGSVPGARRPGVRIPTGGERMSNAATHTTVRIVPENPHLRRALLSSGRPLVVGEAPAHTDRVDRDGQDCTDLEALVAAIGASLVGVFAEALAAHEVFVAPGDLSATAVGTSRVEAGVPILKTVVVTYYVAKRLGVDERTLAAVRRVHAQTSSVYRSVHPQVEVSTAVEKV